jgi:bifunctional DNA-binding transcriptional regulator/antitoxin component of YhaV-PrlF toxin-antitoxin module
LKFEKTTGISREGQIILPKQARAVLKANVVRVIVENHRVRIEPVENEPVLNKPKADLAGRLSKFASNVQA